MLYIAFFCSTDALGRSQNNKLRLQRRYKAFQNLTDAFLYLTPMKSYTSLDFSDSIVSNSNIQSTNVESSGTRTRTMYGETEPVNTAGSSNISDPMSNSKASESDMKEQDLQRYYSRSGEKLRTRNKNLSSGIVRRASVAIERKWNNKLRHLMRNQTVKQATSADDPLVNIPVSNSRNKPDNSSNESKIALQNHRFIHDSNSSSSKINNSVYHTIEEQNMKDKDTKALHNISAKCNSTDNITDNITDDSKGSSNGSKGSNIWISNTSSEYSDTSGDIGRGRWVESEGCKGFRVGDGRVRIRREDQSSTENMKKASNTYEFKQRCLCECLHTF